MGLAASQARLLSLTAQQSNNEYEGQCINNRRLSLSNKMTQIAKEYSDGMSNKTIKMTIAPGVTADLASLSPADLYSALNPDGDGGFQLVDSSGNELSKGEDASGNPCYTDQANNVIPASQVIRLLRAGTLHIANGEMTTAADGTAVSYALGFDWRSDQSGTFSDTYDTSDDAAVSAKYEYESALVQAEDKKMDMQLKNLDTQHKAIETELDAVKKVIEKNAQTSFKTFG
jgi:hypothetical protein